MPRSIVLLAAVAAVVPTVAVGQATQPAPPATAPAPGEGADPPPEPAVTPETTNADIDRWLSEEVEGVERAAANTWRFELAERMVLIVTDEAAGRMRVMSPVGELPDDPALLRRLLEANFDTALDARYAVRGGVLWSAFIHPLPTLSRADFNNGVAQVVTLAITTGTTFSSSGMRFGFGDDEPGEGGGEPSGEGAI